MNDMSVFLIAGYAPIGVAAEPENQSPPGYSFELFHWKIWTSTTNDSGRRFSSYLAINNLLATTTCFRKNNYSTWIHPHSRLRHQIDHFIVKKDSLKHVLDAGVTDTY